MASNFEMKLGYYRNNPYKSRYSGATDDVIEVNCDLCLNGHKLERADISSAYIGSSGNQVGYYIRNGFTGTVLLPKSGVGNHTLTFEAGRLVKYD